MAIESAVAIPNSERNWTNPKSEKSDQSDNGKFLRFPDQKEKKYSEDKKAKKESATAESQDQPENSVETSPETREKSLPSQSEENAEDHEVRVKEETRINQITTKLKEVSHTEALAAKAETLWNQALEHKKWLQQAVEMMRNHRAITGALVGVAIFQLEAITNVPIPPELMARLTAGGVGAAAGYIASAEGKISSTVKGAALGLGVAEVLTQTKGDEVIQKTAGKILPFSGLGKVLGSFIDDLPLLLSTRRKVK